MHGTISLQSKLDQGTIATFSVPFNKPQYQSATPSLVGLDALPHRLQCELSLSCNTSSRGSYALPGRITPPLPSPAGADNPSMQVNGAKSAPSGNRSSAQFTEAQKKNFHILVVEDNAINQQIALKTIQNLGFSVSAVWNGKEALDYLYKATADLPDSTNTLPESTSLENTTPVPNLVLMDVQMPVLDGYRATHTLRHHSPFKNNPIIQRIPVVAMTASAIQGDREKCQRAGMDDYLAKPVQRRVLESMILKWIDGAASKIIRDYPSPGDSKASSAERPDMNRCGTGDSSNCPGSEYSDPAACAPSLSMTNILPAPSHQSLAHRSQRPNLLSVISEEKVRSLRSSGEPNTALSEGDRGLRRVEAEEQAASLRDEKLLAATGSASRPYLNDGAGFPTGEPDNSSPVFAKPTSPSSRPSFSGLPLGGGSGSARESYSDQRATTGNMNIMALTEENVEKLNADRADYSTTHHHHIYKPPTSPTIATGTKAPGGDVVPVGELGMNEAPRPMSPPPRPPTAEPLLEAPLSTQEEAAVLTDEEELPPSPPPRETTMSSSKTREGRLSMQDRKGSDWSQVTAKP